MDVNNNTNNKKGFSLSNITKSSAFSSLAAALMAIVLGLIFGFIIMDLDV